MINILTGQPVSEEMINVINRLQKKEAVPLNEIQNVTEIKEAYSCIADSKPTFLLANRGGIQNGVLNRLQKQGSAVIDENHACMLTGEIKKEKRIDIVIGLPASGKSSAIVEPLSQFYGSRIIDSDEAKKLLPEYNNGWGASAVHTESQRIAERQYQIAMEHSENIIYPRVGGDYDELLNKVIKSSKEQGYKVYVHFNELEQNKALGRMLQRYLDTGRFLAPELISKYGGAVSETYEKIKGESIIDGFSKWDNDVAKGAPPILVETSGNIEYCKSFQASQRLSELLRQTGCKLVIDNSDLHDGYVIIKSSSGTMKRFESAEQAASYLETKQRAARDITTELEAIKIELSVKTAECERLKGKIEEVNRVFKSAPPELAAQYKACRDAIRNGNECKSEKPAPQSHSQYNLNKKKI